MTHSVRYQPILHTLYYTLHTEHAYCLSYRFLNNVVISTVIEMVEMVEILDGRLGKRSFERVRYVINNLLHLVIVKYGDISLILCISTRLRLVTILSLLLKYLTLTRVISLIITYLPPLTVHFSMTRSVIYQPILHTLYCTLHTEHAYCLSYLFLNNVVLTTSLKWLKWFKYSMKDLVSIQLSE